MGYVAQADWENVVIQASEFSFYILWKTIEFDEFYFLQTSSPLDSDFPQLGIHSYFLFFKIHQERNMHLVNTSSANKKILWNFESKIQSEIFVSLFVCLSLKL